MAMTKTGVGPAIEPVLPRKKKHPELAYKTHEFLAMSNGAGSDDSMESTGNFERARSEERNRGYSFHPSRRSRSEGPHSTHRNPILQSEYRLQYGWVNKRRQVHLQGQSKDGDRAPLLGKGASDSNEKERMTASYPPAAPSSRSHSEYRMRFAWPVGYVTPHRHGDVKVNPGAGPRKSISMGTIQAEQTHSRPAPVHRGKSQEDSVDHGAAKGIENKEKALVKPPAKEPSNEHMLMNDRPPAVKPDIQPKQVRNPVSEPMKQKEQEDRDELQGEEKIQEENKGKEEQKPRRRREYRSEYKQKFRPFSQYEYVDGKFFKRLDSKLQGQADLPGESWYREVLELRKKAGEYKFRGWGTELVPQHIAELYNKQIALWEQVSRRSSLSALSLASSTPRPTTKEEKEKENNKKSSPTKPTVPRPHTAPIKPSVPEDKTDAVKKKMQVERLPKRTEDDIPHSKKDVRHHLEKTTGAVDGALLTSPTRDQIEPTHPKKKEEEASIRSPPKASPKSSPHSVSGRSMSAGPERKSPKRQARPASATVPSGSAAPGGWKVHLNGPTQAERRPRPTTEKEDTPEPPGPPGPGPKPPVVEHKPEYYEPVVKSPPEPTRVKSPEQIMMRSPDPVNWTVPLDTGKTFTVTQNVREGEDGKPRGTPPIEIKPLAPEFKAPSETKPVHKDVKSPPLVVKAATMEEKHSSTDAPSAIVTKPQVYPTTVPTTTTGPALTHATPVPTQAPKTAVTAPADISPAPTTGARTADPMTMSMIGSFSAVNGFEEKPEDIPTKSSGSYQSMAESKSSVPESSTSDTKPSPPTGCDLPTKTVPGTTLKCLDDPSFMFDDPKPPASVRTSSPKTSPPKTSSPYKVLEAPVDPKPPPTSREIPHVSFKVLESPGMPSDVMYQPTDSPNDSSGSQTTTGSATQSGSAQQARPSPYRVLEADIPPIRPSASPYRVLEAPDLPRIPETKPIPSTQESPTKPPSLVSPSSGRSLASDVLEKARTRFDKFWGKSKDSDKEGKV